MNHQNPSARKKKPELELNRKTTDGYSRLSSLKERSVRGGAVTLGSQAARFLLHIVSTAILARLLVPADFGLVAMVLAITNFALMFRDLGLSTATIQQTDITEDQIANLFWMNSAFGGVVSILIAASAPLVTMFYQESRLTLVTLALAPMFFFAGLSVQHVAILRRRMQFFTIAVIDIVSLSVSVMAGILSAMMGLSYWSLVIMQIAGSITGTVAVFIALPWIPGFPRRNVPIRRLLSFGGQVTGFNVINYFARNADNLLIGRVLGDAALGFYSKAYGLMMLPIRQLQGPITGVGLPALSHLKDNPDRFARYYYQLIQLLALISAPIAVYLGFFSHQVIAVVLGSGWEEAAFVFTILAPVAAIQAVSGTSGLVMLSLGQGKRYFRIGAVSSPIVVLSFIVGLPWGITGVATSYTVVTVFMTIPVLMYSFRQSSISVCGFMKSVSLPYGAAALAGVLSRSALYFVGALGSISVVLSGAIIFMVGYWGIFLLIPYGRNILNTALTGVKLIFSHR